MWTDIFTYTIFLPLIWLVQTTMPVGGYMYGDVTTQERYTYLIPGETPKWDTQWDLIELSEGKYTIPPYVAHNCAYYNENGYDQFVNIQHVPVWARIYPDKENSPPKPGYVDDFIRFLDWFISYCQPETIELWNEPDTRIDSGAFWATSFGDMPLYYVDVINQVYRELKPKYPNVTFAVGAVTFGNLQDENWAKAVFAAGLKGDVFSFHSYNYNPNTDTGWLEYKYQYLNQLTDMPLMVSETALLCKPEWVCDDTFRANQAAYLDNALHFAQGKLEGLLWYSQNNVWWNNCNLVNESKKIVYPAWYVMQDWIGGGR
jgi:hypothetical protein